MQATVAHVFVNTVFRRKVAVHFCTVWQCAAPFAVRAYLPAISVIRAAAPVFVNAACVAATGNTWSSPLLVTSAWLRVYRLVI